MTLVYPFVDDADLGAVEIGRLRGVLGTFAPFEVTCARFGHFDAEPPVLYLEPEPAQPFLDMIAALVAKFPAFPPFGGIHETTIPHLTLGYSHDAAALRAVEADVTPCLPIRATVAEASAMEHGAMGWQVREHIALRSE